jgi:predicted ATPase
VISNRAGGQDVARGQKRRNGGQWPGLPVPLTGLVGRDRELGDVARLLTNSRLVTLVGSGGVGKTRLAIEVAAALAERFADGAVLIDLSSVTYMHAAVATVARVVGVEERADSGLEGRVMDVLSRQELVLVLDNCEHLLAESGELAERVLGSCPDVRVLATSREGLGISGEITWRVPSLAFPWPGHLPTSDQLNGFGAVALFVERARAARPALQIAASDVAALTSICFRLDGIPLALELAAARASAMSIREIADHLDDQLTLLTRTAGGPARHQTLRASVDWSHRLLSKPEQALFRRLAVFAGGWSLRAAEEVCADPPVAEGPVAEGPAAENSVARLLAALVDKSLVHPEDTVTGTRYRLVEAIKAFAGEQLTASEETERIRDRHARYFADLAESAGPRLNGPDQDYWARCLDQEQANFRAARAWCSGDATAAEVGLTIASGLGKYWLIRGLLTEGAGWLGQALDQGQRPVPARGAAMAWLAIITSLRSGFRDDGRLYADSISLYEQAGDRQNQAQVLAVLGFWRANQADHQGAAEALEGALRLARQSANPYTAAFALLMASMAASLGANPELARAQATESIAMFTVIGDRRSAGYARCVLADCETQEGNPRGALAILRACVADFEAITDRWGLLLSAGSAVLAHAALGDLARAAVAAGVAEGLSGRIGGQLYPGTRAAIDAYRASAEAELGAAMTALRNAGIAVGRTDQIAAALGLAAQCGPIAEAPDQLLTNREQEIARLISSGLTNRQIGAQLRIARRTVDTHVGHILAKLGCANRAQVAALTSIRNVAQPDI